MPEEFLNLAAQSIGKGPLALFIEELRTGDTVTSIRINPFKYLSKQTDAGSPLNNVVSVKTPQVPWCAEGFYLPERPVFTLDPLFHCGAYYVQEASSMFVEIVFRAIEQQQPSFRERALKFLDLCAAPGGKSTHLVSLMNEKSLLVSNEVIKNRATILADNLAKWGAANVLVSNNDPRDFTRLSNYFDVILVDAPCSGEGMFRKEPEVIKEWSPANVALCAGRQKRILQDIWPALAPGGYLIYSTCTFNHFENDDNLQYLADEFGAEIVNADEVISALPVSGSVSSVLVENQPVLDGTAWANGILRTKKGGYQFIPGMVLGEGQFFAIVRKPNNGEKGWRGEKNGNQNKKRSRNNSGTFVKDCPYLPFDQFAQLLSGDLLKGYPLHLADEMFYLEHCLKVVHSGVAIAVKKGKDYIPHADLALSRYFMHITEKGKGSFKMVELTRSQALRFLAKEPLVFENEPNGYLFLTYMGFGLGFVKNLGNRSNNLLPMARRIRMDIHI